MAEFFLSLYEYGFKFIVLAAVAVGALIAGKKYRDHKNAQTKADE